MIETPEEMARKIVYFGLTSHEKNVALISAYTERVRQEEREKDKPCTGCTHIGVTHA